MVAYNIEGEIRLDITSYPPLRDEDPFPGITEKVSDVVDENVDTDNIDLAEGDGFRVGKILVDNDTGEILEVGLRD